MMLALQYFVQWKAMHGQHIGRRTSAEIAAAKDRRSCELIAERLIELKVISEDEKEAYIQMMTTVPKEAEDGDKG